ncbi:MAG: hypothetical protein U1D67_06745, partial [Dehalococcoidia bacterium]|nr:hypothetical protein [Dehalococcoidia bacterium]
VAIAKVFHCWGGKWWRKTTMNTRKYRDKYRAITGNRGQNRMPAGGRDVLELCRMVEQLSEMIRDLQRNQTLEIQNEIETKLWRIFND